MPRKCTLLALALMSFITAAAFAQSSAEFGRVSGGQIDLAIKAPSQFSGSLGLTMFQSNGGSALTRFSNNVLENLGDRSTLGASFRTQRNIMPTTIPSSFLSLRYTGIVSSNMFVTATVSQSSVHAQ